MKEKKMFGMIQPKNKSSRAPEVYQVGCLGKIVNFHETEDKRIIINLSGIIRFKIKKELDSKKLYRKFKVDYSEFMHDLKVEKEKEKNEERNKLLKNINFFFEKIDYSIAFYELEKLNFNQLVDTICMISPFSIEEKQKLIEAKQIDEKFQVLNKIIEFNLFDFLQNKTIQ
jgi:Lon protease-like protein